MWAFSDESERGSTVMFGVAFVPTGAVATARREMRSLLLPGQRRVHMAKESPRRRRQLLDAVAALELDARVLLHRRVVGVNRVEARRRLVMAAATIVVDEGATTWVLDDQDPAQSTRDRHAIAAALGRDAALVYDHRPSRDEPLLWVVDVVVWAVGAGREWSRRIDALVTTRTVP